MGIPDFLHQNNDDYGGNMHVIREMLHSLIGHFHLVLYKQYRIYQFGCFEQF